MEATLSCDELAGTFFDHGYSMDQIFNIDEISLNYKMLLRKSLVAKANREVPGAKKYKKHVTILMRGNASGSF